MSKPKQYCDGVDDDARGLVPILKQLLDDLDFEDDWSVAAVLHEALHSAYNKGADNVNARLNQAVAEQSALSSAQGWVALARWCSVHAKERRIGCNEYAAGRWKVWAEWNDDAIEIGSGPTADEAARDLCDKLATRHPSSALPPPPKAEGKP